MTTAYSGANRPLIPGQAGHLFRRMSAGDSGACRPPIPGMSATPLGVVDKSRA
jgi:hypothetical protein